MNEISFGLFTVYIYVLAVNLTQFNFKLKI